jgi:pyridinium-3,5-biscarboxylic acid mononucleotide synthase
MSAEPVPTPPGLGHTRPDLDRVRRVGMPEAVYAQGKTPEQCREIVEHLLAVGSDPVIVTRAAAEHRAALAPLGPDAVASATLTWRHAAPRQDRGPVVVVSGGTSDQPVVDECAATLTALGAPVRQVRDVGVAGLHRLLGALEELSDAEVVVAVAGMEASLPTVLGGLVPQPIVAVPTSTGYGSSFEGITAVLSLLSSCAPGVAVVGIDNGYGAACAALRILGPAS